MCHFFQGGLLQLCLQHFVDSMLQAQQLVDSDEVIIAGYVVHGFANCNDTDIDISSIHWYIGDISLDKPAIDLEATMCSANPQKLE